MAAAYSLDLRKKILSAWQNQEGSLIELAQRFKVSLAFIRNFLRRYRETGDKNLSRSSRDIYLLELQGSILDRTGIEVSESSLCRQL